MAQPTPLSAAELWKKYKRNLTACGSLGIRLDVSRMGFGQRFFGKWAEPMAEAFAAMDALEQGSVANPDEQRMVGHYWLRNPELAPSDELKTDVVQTLADVKAFVSKVHDAELTPPTGGRFSDLLLIGIGGSALGPQLLADALGSKKDRMRVHFLDNTDPDGFQRTLENLKTRLKNTLSVVISKSGGTPETRNGMLEAQAAYAAQSLDFAKHAVAVTGNGSKLDGVAESQGWLARFPMFDWIGGRTSVMSAVGLLPLALQGIDIDAFLDGAKQMDDCTRIPSVEDNPAARLALMWHLATDGKGKKDMVILPYKDRLLLFSRYLQQLVMESLGKEHDLDGNTVEQGIAVYGNKGSTDQHAYVQQLRDGVNNFFATFLVVLQDVPNVSRYHPIAVEEGVTSGDFLTGFWLGTRQALYEKNRGSVSIICDKLDTKTLGALIALYERAVGLYATLVNINAYHQPGVEAGKKAAGTVLDLQKLAVAHLQSNPDAKLLPDELADAIGQPDAVETIFHVMEHLSANRQGVRRIRSRYTAL
ncbi:MAG: glucose-6-phosphate isomerase [Planctomycetota bacterium]